MPVTYDGLEQGGHIARGKQHQLEQMLTLSRQIEVAVANGKNTRRPVEAARKAMADIP